VLQEQHGAYISMGEVAEVSVPATLQATIAACVDRLDPKVKGTLSAAAGIGSRFGLDLLTMLGPNRWSLTWLRPSHRSGQLHPATRVCVPPSAHTHGAYESQLKSDRAELHRRVAAAIESRQPTSADEDAALIAEHREAAGDLPAAYGWHMRAATWATNRDIAAARLSWERARKIADALTAAYPDRATMRIALRTMLCATAFRVHEHVAGARFDELRQLCTAAGDKASLAIGMAACHDYRDRNRAMATSLGFEGHIERPRRCRDGDCPCGGGDASL
jgi:hypothetical protein